MATDNASTAARETVLDTSESSATATLYAAATGAVNAAYYQKVFARFEDLQRTTTSWNWGAALITLNWMVFRQLWGAALAYCGALVAAVLMIMGIGRLLFQWSEELQWALLGLVLVASVVVPGLAGNALLYLASRKRVEQALAAHTTLPEACAMLQRQAPSKRRLGLLAALNLALLGLVAAIYQALPAVGQLPLDSQRIADARNVAVGRATDLSSLPIQAASAPQAAASAPQAAASAPQATASVPLAAASSPLAGATVASAPLPATSAPQPAASAAVAPATLATPALPPTSAANPAAKVAAVASPVTKPAASAGSAEKPAVSTAQAGLLAELTAGAPTSPAPRSRASSPKAATAPQAAKPATAPQAAKPAVAKPSAAQPIPSGMFVVNAGLFADSNNALNAFTRLQDADLPATSSEFSTSKGKRTRVRVGPFATEAEAERAADKVRALGLEAQVVRP